MVHQIVQIDLQKIKIKASINFPQRKKEEIKKKWLHNVR